MTYVGRGVDAISNVEKLDNITFDGSTTYNLTKSSVAFTPSGANNILISINGVIQQGNFSTANATIIFDFSPSSNDTCNFIMHYGTGVLNVPADGVVSTAKVADDAITTDKLANSINSAITANTAKTTNATHSGEVTGATALTIADNIVDEANLKVSNAPTNGYSLVARSGNTGGMTWESVGGKMVLLQSASTQTNASTIEFDEVFDKDLYSFYRLMGWFRPATAGTTMQFRWRSSSADLDASTYYGVTHGKAINGGGQADVSWDRWGGNYAKVLADMKNLAYNGATMDMLLRPRFASGTSTQSVASMNFRAGFWDNNSGSERSIVVNGACSYTDTGADMDNGGFVLFQSSGQYDEFEYVLYGVTQS